MDYAFLPWLTLAGAAAGFINTLAGGGSMLTLPLLVAMGLPTPVANGTNRVAILLQNIVAVASFAHFGVQHLKRAGRLLGPTAAGAVLGSWSAAVIEVEWLERIFGSLLIGLSLLVLWRPGLFTRSTSEPRTFSPLVIGIAFFGIGLWGGFAQIGVGFLFLGALVVAGGWNLVDANAIKVTLILGYTALSLAVFGWHDQVDLVAGLALGVGNMSGGWFAARTAVKKGSAWVRWVLVIGAVLGAVRFLVL